MHSSSEFLKDYSLAEGAMRGIYDSPLRLAILAALRDGPLRLADLRRAINASAPNASAKAKDLEEMGLVERANGDFRLTDFGRAALGNTEDAVDFYVARERFKEFWKARDLSGVPDFLLKRIGDLKNSDIIYGKPSDVSAGDEQLYDLIRSARGHACGLLPVMDPQWARLFLDVACKGLITCELILTPSALEGMAKALSKERASVAKCKSSLTVFKLDNDPKLTFGATDKFLDINFKLRDVETQYMEADMLSRDPKAIKWGFELFEYYKKQAKPADLADYM